MDANDERRLPGFGGNFGGSVGTAIERDDDDGVQARIAECDAIHRSALIQRAPVFAHELCGEGVTKGGVALWAKGLCRGAVDGLDESWSRDGFGNRRAIARLKRRKESRNDAGRIVFARDGKHARRGPCVNGLRRWRLRVAARG